MSDRGSSAFYTPRMDHEYHLDMRTARFDPWLQDGWHETTNGFRSFAGSIDRSVFATTTDIRHREQVSPRHALSIVARQQDDLSARRLFIDVGYHFNVTGRHVVSVSHTGGSFKPDLDLQIGYAAHLRTAGQIAAGIVFLDYANNVIYDVLGVDPALDDTTRSYSRIPVLFHARWQSPAALPVRLEIAAGMMPPAHARIERQSEPDDMLDTRHLFRYAGGQLTGSVGPVRLGIRHLYSEEGRSFFAPRGSTADRAYATRQRSHRTSVFAGHAWPVRSSHQLSFSGLISHLVYADTQHGSRFDGASVRSGFRLHERRVEAMVRLAASPLRSGFRGGITVLTDARTYEEGMDVFEAEYLIFRQWSPNQRLSIHAGYQSRPGVFIEAGVSVDLDGDRFYTDRGATRFDGGFGRLQVTW